MSCKIFPESLEKEPCQTPCTTEKAVKALVLNGEKSPSQKWDPEDKCGVSELQHWGTKLNSKSDGTAEEQYAMQRLKLHCTFCGKK